MKKHYRGKLKKAKKESLDKSSENLTQSINTKDNKTDNTPEKQRTKANKKYLKKQAVIRKQLQEAINKKRHTLSDKIKDIME